jgi:hypothetical protein
MIKSVAVGTKGSNAKVERIVAEFFRLLVTGIGAGGSGRRPTRHGG